MILTWTEQEEDLMVPLQYGLYGTFTADRPVTLEDVLECCNKNNALLQDIQVFLRQQGFRRERPTRQQLDDKMQIVLNEVRDQKKDYRRRVDRGR